MRFIDSLSFTFNTPAMTFVWHFVFSCASPLCLFNNIASTILYFVSLVTLQKLFNIIDSLRRKLEFKVFCFHFDSAVKNHKAKNYIEVVISKSNKIITKQVKIIIQNI